MANLYYSAKFKENYYVNNVLRMETHACCMTHIILYLLIFLATPHSPVTTVYSHT